MPGLTIAGLVAGLRGSGVYKLMSRNRERRGSGARFVSNPPSVSRVMAKDKTTLSPEFSTGDHSGLHGDVPEPDHHVDVPGAPSTHPPVPPVVPSESAIADIWNAYGPAMILIAAGVVIALILLMGGF